MPRQPKGNVYGTHRVIEPEGILPQPALRLNNNFCEFYDNEILCDVKTLNLEAASFADIRKRAKGDPHQVAEIILDIVAKSGKLRNPWTGTGGNFIGRVAKIGQALADRVDLRVGERIASLVSLSLTPLQIDDILAVHMEKGQVDIEGQALLFESGVWARLPGDFSEPLALAVLDVAGAPAQVSRIVKSGDTVAVIGARGKSGMLCCYQAKECAGPGGRVIAIVHREAGMGEVEFAPFVDEVVVGSADRALELLDQVAQVTGGALCDVVVSCVSSENCEMGAIMIAKERGKVYFFAMSTSFTKAALGAEGIGKDVEMIIGNGYAAGHAGVALNILHRSIYLKELYSARYG